MIRDESKYDKKSLEKSKKECVGGQNRRKVTKKELDKMTDFENRMKNNGSLTRPAVPLVKTAFLKSTEASETHRPVVERGRMLGSDCTAFNGLSETHNESISDDKD